MKMKLETITPEKAAAMLRGNVRNRPVRPTRVDYYASEMAAGRWMTTSETIGITDDGRVVDGQHRLLAIQQSGVTLDMWVAYGVPMAAQDVTNFNAPRTLGDQLSLDGMQNTNLIMASVRTIVALCCHHQWFPISMGATQIVLGEFHRELTYCVDKASAFRPARKGWLVGAMTFAYRADERVSGFIDGFFSGENLSRGSPIMAAREWFINNGGGAMRAEQMRGATTILTAMHNALEGNERVILRKTQSGVDYFLTKNQKWVEVIRAELKGQMAERAASTARRQWERRNGA